jgi:hypothetical protein
MTIFKKQTETGEFWFKGLNGEKIEGPTALEPFIQKYQNLSSITNILSGNKIAKFDVIDNTIIIIGENAYLIEEFQVIDNKIHPLNNYNNSYSYPLSAFSSVDYWYFEKEKELSVFNFILNEFDFNISVKFLKSGLEINKKTLTFETGLSGITFVNPIKVTFNPNTNDFNVTTIFYKTPTSNFSLFSVNINKNLKNVNPVIIDNNS